MKSMQLDEEEEDHGYACGHEEFILLFDILGVPLRVVGVHDWEAEQVDKKSHDVHYDHFLAKKLFQVEVSPDSQVQLEDRP